MTRPFVRMWPPLLASSCPLRHECKSYSRENIINVRTRYTCMQIRCMQQTAGMARVQAIHTCMQTIVRSPATYHMHVHVRNDRGPYIMHAYIAKDRSWLSIRQCLLLFFCHAYHYHASSISHSTYVPLRAASLQASFLLMYASSVNLTPGDTVMHLYARSYASY